MNANRLLQLSVGIKILSRVFGVFFIGYGFLLGVLGIGPDGVVPIQWRIIGIVTLIQGLLYFRNNSILSLNRTKIYTYLVMTTIPGLVLFFAAARGVWQESFDFFVQSGGFLSVVVLIPISLLAPLSLILFIESKKRQKHIEDNRGRVVNDNRGRH